MPNWVYNHVHISGDAETLSQFWANATKPYPTAIKDPDNTYGTLDGVWEMSKGGEFSFMNIVPPTDLEAYFTTSNGSEPAGNWYNWNISNWGTKWDVDVEDEDIQDDHIYIKFDTAWSPPMDIFEAIVRDNPTLSLSVEWEEEQGFGAELESDGEGGLVLVKEWDIPASHADYVERDNEGGCTCAYTDDQEDWYDDCPGKTPDEDDGHLRPIENLAFESIS